MTPAKLPAVVDAGCLTDALRGSGVLDGGCVTDITVESDGPTILSRILRLSLTYDQAEPLAPKTVIVKTDLGDGASAAWNGGQQEVAFYTHIAPVLSDRVVPRCFDAQWDSAAQNWYLLLEDLTDTHTIPTQWPLPPTQVQCETILTARARLHAAWWDDPRLGVSVGTWLDADAIDAWRQRFERNYVAFADRLGDNLSPERRDLYERFLAAMPHLAQRSRTRRDMTIIQGDAHVWNCFLPRDGGDDVRLFDWDSWRIGVASADLAYMMAVHWYPDRRRMMERPLLDHYHSVLVAHGVSGYDRSALADDYRLSALAQIATPVFQAAAHIPPVIWWAISSVFCWRWTILGCRELLT